MDIDITELKGYKLKTILNCPTIEQQVPALIMTDGKKVCLRALSGCKQKLEEAACYPKLEIQ